jgi:hypothetical protein
MRFLDIYLYSVAACAALGIFELFVRLREDRKTWAEYRLTWGDLFGFSVCVFVPGLNVLVLGWPMYSRVWDCCEKLIEKWDKPIVTQERQK